MHDYYETLGLDKENKVLYTQENIHHAYIQKVLTVHPDKRPGLVGKELEKAEEEFRAVREAYFILGDAQKRKCYDEGLKAPLEDMSGDYSKDYYDFLREINTDPTFNRFFCGMSAHSLWVKNELNKKIDEEYLKLNGFFGIKAMIYSFIWVYLNPVYWVFADNLSQQFKHFAVDNYYRSISMGDALVASALVVLAGTVPAIVFFPAAIASIGPALIALSILLGGILGYEIYNDLSVRGERLGVTIRESRSTFFDPVDRIVFQSDQQEPPLPSQYVEMHEFCFFKSNRGVSYSHSFATRGQESQSAPSEIPNFTESPLTLHIS